MADLRARLASMVLTTEPSADERASEVMVKELTSGEPLSVCRVHSDFIETGRAPVARLGGKRDG